MNHGEDILMNKFGVWMLLTAFAVLFSACGDDKKTATDADGTPDEATTDQAVTDDTVTDTAVTDTAGTDDAVADEAVTDEAATDDIVTDDAQTDEQIGDDTTINTDYDIVYPDDIAMSPVDPYDGTYGWEIMKEGYPVNDTWDALSFEWDYFMIHNEDDSFSGSVGYLVANPRGKQILGGMLGKLVPGGGNIAIAGQFDKDLPPVADYENFDPDNGHTTTLSGTERSLWVENTDKGYWGRMTPDPIDNSMLLEGKTGNFEWELTVRQDWTVLTTGADTFVKVTDDQIDTKIMGIAAVQQWNVHMFWPRTKITGWIKDLRDGTEYPIDAHGYRENSWGRWAFNQGGWDFGTHSDARSKVMFGWQSYHFNSTRLDYLDMGFIDNGEYKLVNFRADQGQLGWKHDLWSFDPVARQCVPRDTTLIAKNANYRVDTYITIGQGQVAMLSEATATVKKYVIMIQIPWFKGTITRLSDNTVIATFEGRGGGEFSTERAAEGTTTMTDADCAAWGAKFSVPFPQ